MDTYSGSGIGMIPLLVLVVLGVVAFAVWVGSVAWVWRDAERRGQPGFIVAVVVALLFWPLSFVVWLLVRPEAGSSGTARGGSGRGLAIGLVVVLLVAVGGVVAWDLTRKPSVRSWTSSVGEGAFLTVKSEPSGATVEVQVAPKAEAIKFRDGPYRVNGEAGVTGVLQIGQTPIEKYALAASNQFGVEYNYGWIRGKKRKTTSIDLEYTIRVAKDGYHTQQLENVTLTPGNTASFTVQLLPVQ